MYSHFNEIGIESSPLFFYLDLLQILRRGKKILFQFETELFLCYLSLEYLVGGTGGAKELYDLSI